jgi:DnaJ family protein A protein 2
VLISKGMQNGQRVVIPGEVDDPMGGAPGDVIVNILEVRHPRFTRRNADLLLEMRISLAEALTGFETSFKHLDGRTVRARKG